VSSGGIAYGTPPGRDHAVVVLLSPPGTSHCQVPQIGHYEPVTLHGACHKATACHIPVPGLRCERRYPFGVRWIVAGCRREVVTMLSLTPRSRVADEHRSCVNTLSVHAPMGIIPMSVCPSKLYVSQLCSRVFNCISMWVTPVVLSINCSFHNPLKKRATGDIRDGQARTRAAALPICLGRATPPLDLVAYMLHALCVDRAFPFPAWPWPHIRRCMWPLTARRIRPPPQDLLCVAKPGPLQATTVGRTEAAGQI
jgi:hypothetical protein